MRTFLVTIIFALFVGTGSAQDVIGEWGGKLVLPSGSLTLVFHITRTESGYQTTCDSPDQGVAAIPTKLTTFQDSILIVEIPTIGASYKGKMKVDGIIYGTFTQGVSLPLNFSKGKIEKPKRPQEPQAPFPYKIEEVKFKNKRAGITLAGTLTVPQQGTKFPVVVLVTGSGAQNRDEEIMGHKPFWVIADYLTRKGVAVLRCDDRGMGESEGVFASATNEDLSSDLEASLNYLKTRKEVNTRQMGVIGHSCGGTIAFMQAAKNKDISFVVSLAGAAIKGDSLMLKQTEASFKSTGMTDLAWSTLKPVLRNRYALLTQNKEVEEIRKELHADVNKMIPADNRDDENVKKRIDADIQTMTSPWYLDFMRYDMTPDLKKIKCPVLALNGANDIQVDADMNLTAIEQRVGGNGNKNVITKKYLGLNHLFQHCQSCTIAEYGQLEETISQEVLQDISTWILKQIKQ